MNKDIRNVNDNNQLHGYNERYNHPFFLWYRANYINDKPIGYHEWHNDMFSKTQYYIR